MALPKFYKVVTDQQGNIVPQVLGSVYNKGTAVLASLYQDDAGVTPLANPMTSDATYGSFKFYINPGHYDLSFTKPGYTFEPIYDMQVPADVVTLGTMATQNANAVAITGGSATLTGALAVANTFQADPVSTQVSVPIRLLVGGNYLGINTRQQVFWDKTSQHGILLMPGSDAGSFATLNFLNASGVQVGSITQTGSGVAYNTTSDRRLKTALAPLTNALTTILGLQPQTYRWRLDDTPGVGLVADEVQALVPEAVSGTPDGAQFQGIDYSKLVPHLIGAIQELLAQVQTLTARVAQLEGAV